MALGPGPHDAGLINRWSIGKPNYGNRLYCTECALELAGGTPQYYYEMAQWGFNVGRQDCETYMTVLFKLNRERGRNGSVITALGTAASAVVTASSRSASTVHPRSGLRPGKRIKRCVLYNLSLLRSAGIGLQEGQGLAGRIPGVNRASISEDAAPECSPTTDDSGRCIQRPSGLLSNLLAGRH